MKNEKEAIALMGRYETITLEEIQEVWRDDGLSYARALTGFGETSTCTLCLTRKVDNRCWTDSCDGCFWGDMPTGHCNAGSSHKTYLAIRMAHTPRELFNAYRERAKYMRKVYNVWKENK